MKKWMRRIFFCGESSRGAFFALTFLLFLVWFDFSAFCAILAFDYRLVCSEGFGLLLLPFVYLPAIYIIILLFKEVVHWAKLTPHFGKRVLWTLLGVAALAVFAAILEEVWLPVESVARHGCFGTIARLCGQNVLVLVFIGFCFLFRPVVPSVKLLTAMLACAASWLVFTTLLQLTDDGLGIGLGVKDTGLLFPWIGPYASRFGRWFSLNGNGSFWFALAGFLLAGTAYYCAGEVLARVSGLSLRRLFRLEIRIQWYIMAGIYAVFLGLAMMASWQFHDAVRELAAHFGHPMAAAELGRLYYEGRTADDGFWEKANALKIEYAKIAEDNEYEFSTHPEAILPPELHSKRQKDLQDFVATAHVDELLAAPLPPIARDYEGEPLAVMMMPDLSLCGTLVAIERRRCLYAVEAGDFTGASHAFAHVDALVDYLGRDPSFISYCRWLYACNVRNEMLASLLPANLAPESWLEEQARMLLHNEAELVRREKEIVYASAVRDLDLFHHFAEGTDYFSVDPTLFQDEYPALKYTAIRFLFPQGWWLAAKSARDYARIMKIERFEQAPKKPTGHFLVDMFARYLSYVDIRMRETIARNRIMRSLLQAELHKRQTGGYPEALPGLPPDPFSGQPLKYRKGDCTVIRYYCRENDDWRQRATTLEDCGVSLDDLHSLIKRWEFVSKEETVKAVQVWSVGPDGIDDDGLFFKRTAFDDGEKDKDDIRYVIAY